MTVLGMVECNKYFSLHANQSDGLRQLHGVTPDDKLSGDVSELKVQLISILPLLRTLSPG